MPATSPADDSREDWSRGQAVGGTGGYEEGQADRDPPGDDRARRGRRRAGTGEPRQRAGDNHSGPPLERDDRTELVPMIDDGRGDKPGRSVPLAIAGFTGLLTLALALGAMMPYGPYAVMIFGVQALYAVAWTTASRPPAPRIVAGVGLAAAAAADLAAVWVDPPSLAPLAYVTAAAFVASVAGQLTRPVGRERVTESLGSTLVVVVGVVALGTLVVLSRHPRGTQSIVACLVAAGVAVMVARLTDTVAPHPRLAPHVPRGGAGVLLGLLVGTGAAAVVGSLTAGLSTGAAAVAGLVTALIAVVVDLSVDYAEAGRQLAGEPPASWPAGLMQGPLAAFALAAPVAYTASALLLLDYV